MSAIEYTEYTDAYFGHRSGPLDYSGPIEYFTAGAVTAVSGRARSHPMRRAPATRHASRPAPPPVTVNGCCVPFGVIVDSGDGDELFTRDGYWIIDDPLKLKLEHCGLLGIGTIDEAPTGLYFDGTVIDQRAGAVGGRYWLSPGFSVLDSHRRPDGVLVLDRCRLHEVSLVRHARLAPHTVAAVH